MKKEDKEKWLNVLRGNRKPCCGNEGCHVVITDGNGKYDHLMITDGNVKHDHPLPFEVMVELNEARN